jgi:oxygen-independent coproporphyrinogen-3 oxidase
MAVKRASRINEARDNFEISPAREVDKMLHLAHEAAGKMGMRPYYLYRQKNMVSPLENIGYARCGHDCIYNVQMIEERQTVIGLGGGAGSKFVEPGTWYLTSHYNPKDPETYIRRIDEIIALKVDKLRSFD